MVVLGWEPDRATPFELEAIERTGLRTIPAQAVRADPAGAALRARAALEARYDRLLVHFDVDVIDFTDVPLSENWGRSEGLAYEQAMSALAVLLASPKLAGVTVTELNPDHVEAGAGISPGSRGIWRGASPPGMPNRCAGATPSRRRPPSDAPVPPTPPRSDGCWTTSIASTTTPPPDPRRWPSASAS